MACTAARVRKTHSTVYLTSPLECLTEMLNSTCSKLNSIFFSQPSPPPPAASSQRMAAASPQLTKARKQKFILNTFFSLINHMQIYSFKIHLLSTSYVPGTDAVLNITKPCLVYLLHLCYWHLTPSHHLPPSFLVWTTPVTINWFSCIHCSSLSIYSPWSSEGDLLKLQI